MAEGLFAHMVKGRGQAALNKKDSKDKLQND